MKKRVVIIGCGFGGLAAAQKLSRFKKDIDLAVIDKKQSFDFLPLLPDVIGRGIKPKRLSCSIIDLSQIYGFEFINDEVKRVSLENNIIYTLNREITFDFLIIASGTETNFYGNENIKKQAYKLDDVTDAVRIYQEIEMNDFDSYIISGAGYTGIEIATNLRAYFDNKSKVKEVIIVEKVGTLLGPLPEWMKGYVRVNLEKLGIGVFLNTTIAKIEEQRVVLSDGKIFNNAMLIWAAGVKCPDYVINLDTDKTPQGRLIVDEYLRISRNCFVIGDSANFLDQDKPLRMAVQFSIMQGVCAASNIVRSNKNRQLKRYRPLDFGYIIPMANNKACGKVLGFNIRGLAGILLHYFMCIYRSVSFRNQMGIVGDLIIK